MNSELVTLCKELLSMRQQLRELEIKKSKLFKKRLELEKTLNEKMKAQKLEFLELEGLARFSVFDQTLNGITKNTIKIKKESRDDFKSSEC